MTQHSRTLICLLMMAATTSLLRSEPTTQPTTAPSIQLPKTFTLSPAVKGRPESTWTRIDERTWEETREGARPIRFVQIEAPLDVKDPGIVVTRLPHRDIEVFLPTLDNKDHRMGWRYPAGKEPKNAPNKGGFDWYTLGEMTAVDSSEKSPESASPKTVP